MQVEGIDHVHIEVLDRDAAAEWYVKLLGLQRDERLAEWANDPMGPLILSTANGVAALALFSREAKPASRDATIAFRVSGSEFLAFVEQLPAMKLQDRDCKALTREDVVDHTLSWSLYFLDPDGNRIELTTYDYDFVGLQLN